MTRPLKKTSLCRSKPASRLPGAERRLRVLTLLATGAIRAAAARSTGEVAGHPAPGHTVDGGSDGVE